MLHPQAEPRKPYLASLFESDSSPIVAVSDSMKLVADQVARWLPGRLFTLGTDGFGRSDTREVLRRFFEVDAEAIAIAALSELARRGAVDRVTVARAITELGVDPEKLNPMIS
jgi:pyruvate dehydrogenase E1 component